MKFLNLKLNNGIGTAYIMPSAITCVIGTKSGTDVYLKGDNTPITVSREAYKVVADVEKEIERWALLTTTNR